MNTPPAGRGVLLDLAVEGLVPVLGGCAGVLAGGPEAGLAGIAVGQAVEKAINYFGGHIVQRWCQWFRGQPAEVRQAAVAELASLSPAEARKEAGAALSRLAPEARPEDLAFALEYLSAIPGAVDRALLHDPVTGACALPSTVTFDEPHLLLQILPTDVPPYPVPFELPGTQYTLDEFLGSGGFGAVYRASTHSLQHLPFAIKFCLDPSLKAALHRERSNLERLMKVGGEGWSARVVRLYGYDLEHRTPYLVYEFVSGGDLTHHLSSLRQNKGRDLNAEEVLELILQVVEGLAFAHQHGLVHRDLKPANVLVEKGKLKLADFGLGAITAVRAAQVSRIGATTLDFLTVAERASLFRGAGTPLYMSPEQRRGAPPDPRQDVYSLGVMWFQLLAGDVTRELHPGWAKELAVRYGVPPAHLDLVGRCVGWVEERPRDAGELLPMLQALKASPAPAEIPVASVVPPPPLAAPSSGDLRSSLLTSLVKQLQESQQEAARLETSRARPLALTIVVGIFVIPLCLSFFSHASTGLFVGLGLSAALSYFFFLGHRRLRDEARDRAEAMLRTLTQEFPDKVRQWGGVSVLRNPTTVGEVVERLQPVAPLSGAATGKPPVRPAVGPEQRPVLADRLRELAQTQRRAAWYGERRSVPWWLALIFAAALLGIPGGAAAGFLYELGHAPAVAGWFGAPREYADYRGNTISEVEYDLERRHLPVAAALVGLGTALVLTALGTVLLSRWRWHRIPLLVGVAVCGVFLAAPAGLGAGFLFNYYFSPYAQYPGFPHRAYYDHRGTPLTEMQYDLQRRQIAVGSALVGIATGVGIMILTTGVFLWRWGRRGAVAQQAAALRAQELEAAFPEVVGQWGGRERLRDREFVLHALQATEATRS
jgi:serine/threonine protein kinase